MSDYGTPRGFFQGYDMDAWMYRRTAISVRGIEAKVGDVVTMATSDDTTYQFGTLSAITSDTAVEVTTENGEVFSFTERNRGLWVLRRQRVASWHWYLESVAAPLDDAA